MKRILLVVASLLYRMWLGTATGNSQPHVAVCINGQLIRWMPHLMTTLFHNNPSYKFFFFMNLQAEDKKHKGVFSTESDVRYDNANITSSSVHDGFAYVFDAYNTHNSKLASIQVTTPRTKNDWQNQLGIKLDRITQYIEINDVILTMYEHQVTCLTQIQQFEQTERILFDYVIESREDIYFFKPPNLSVMIEALHTNTRSCHLVAKHCLEWHGINMRFQIMRRNDSISYFGNRIGFYRQLHTWKITVNNPEAFELLQLQKLQYEYCPLEINSMPLTAARHTHKGEFCFIFYEVTDGCIPDGYQAFVDARKCEDLQKKKQQ